MLIVNNLASYCQERNTDKGPFLAIPLRDNYKRAAVIELSEWENQGGE